MEKNQKYFVIVVHLVDFELNIILKVFFCTFQISFIYYTWALSLPDFIAVPDKQSVSEGKFGVFRLDV